LAAGLALAVLLLLVVGGALAPFLAPFPPDDALVDARLLPPLSRRWAVPLADHSQRVAAVLRPVGDGLMLEHRGVQIHLDAARLAGDQQPQRVLFLLGTDALGRDIFSRLLYGARLSFTIAGLAVVMMVVVGVAVGSAAAFGGHFVDALLMRTVDGFLSFPMLFLIIALVAMFEPTVATLVAVLGLTSWMGTSRLVRSELMSLAQRDFVLAARGLGAGPMRVLVRHMLPHALTPLVIQATFAIAALISTEAALSFLGLGVQPPKASWGNLIQDGRAWMVEGWWIATFPALCLAATVLSLNILGDRLRDRLDPRQRS